MRTEHQWLKFFSVLCAKGKPIVNLAVTGNGASTNAPVDLNNLAEDTNYKDVTLTLTAENFEATSDDVTLILAGAGEDGTVATGTGFLNGDALEETPTTKTLAASELVPGAAGGVNGAETKDVTVKVRVAAE